MDDTKSYKFCHYFTGEAEKQKNKEGDMPD